MTDYVNPGPKMVNGTSWELLSPILLCLSGYVMVVYCPGCKMCHHVPVNTVKGQGDNWGWNNDVVNPTFTPSVLVRYNFTLDKNNNKICHSFIDDGKWRFLADSTHDLKGQIVDMVPIPEDEM